MTGNYHGVTFAFLFAAPYSTCGVRSKELTRRRCKILESGSRVYARDTCRDYRDPRWGLHVQIAVGSIGLLLRNFK